MTKDDAVILAENILRCGDKHLGAGMILGAFARTFTPPPKMSDEEFERLAASLGATKSEAIS